MTLRARVVGVGDAFTTKYWNACLLIESSDTRLLIDAPPALARALASLPAASGPAVRIEDIDHVLVTHLHGDHCGGLEQLLFVRRFLVGRKATVHALPEVLAGLWDGRLAGGMEVLLDADGKKHRLTLDDYALLRPLTDPIVREGDLEIEWRHTVHHIPTSAIRARAGGRSLGYSADTLFDPSLVEWLSEADLFFHETGLGIHTPLERLVSLEPSLRERMRVIHYPDSLDPSACVVSCAREGEVVEP